MKTYKAYFSISKNTKYQSFLSFISNSGLNIQPVVSTSFSPKEAALTDMIFVDEEIISQQCAMLSGIKKGNKNFLPVFLLATEKVNEEKNLPPCIDDVVFNLFFPSVWKRRLETYMRLRENEKELHSREEDEFKSLFSESHSVMLLIDPDTGKIEDANQAACRFYGYSHHQLTHMNIQQINFLDDKEVKRELANAGNNRKNHFIFKHQLANGSVKTVEVYSGKVNHKGKYLLYSIIHDITGKIEAEQLLNENTENYRKFVENAPDIIVFIDKQGIIKFINKRIHEYGDYDGKDIVGKHITDFIPPEDSKKAKEAIMRVFNNSQKNAFFSSSLLLRNGKRIPVLTKGILLRHKGEMVNMTIIRDISFIKEAENKLKESKKTFENIFNNNSVAIYIQNEEGVFLDINKAALEQYGYTDKNELIGKTPQFVSAKGKNDLAEIKQHLKEAFNGKPRQFEFWAKSSTGAVFPKLVVVEKGTYFGQSVVYNFSFDMSEQKKMEEVLRESEAKYHNLFHYMKNCVAVYDVLPNGDIIIKDFNRAAENLEKVKRENIVGRKLEDVFPGVHKFGISKAIQKVYKTGKPLSIPVKLYKDHHIAGWRENYLYKLPTGEVVAIYDDVTKQKRAEEKLKESERNFRLLFEMAPFGVFTVHTDGTILDANPTVLKILGSPSVEATKNVNVLHFPPLVKAGYAQYLHDCITTGRMVQFESSYTSKWGRSFVADSTFVPLKDNRGKVKKIYIILRDISEQYQAEQLLKESEEKYRSVFKTSSDMISITEFGSGRYIEINDSFKEILGYSKEELLGKTSLEMNIWVNSDKRKEMISALRKRRFIKDIESRFRRKDGTFITGLFSAQLISLQGNDYITSEIRDITHIKQAEEALRESRQLFENLARISPTGIFRADAKGKTTYVNPRWSEITGVSFEQATSKGWADILFPNEREELLTRWLDNMASNTSSKEKLRIVRPDGTVRWVLGYAIPEIHNGRFVSYVGTITDITDLVKAEQALRESENKYRSLAETSSDLILTFDVHGKLTFLSPSVKKITGYTVDEALYKDFWDFIAPEYVESTIKKFNSGIKGADIPLYEIEIIHKNGKRIPVELNVTSLFDADGNIIGRLAVTRDITDRKKAEEMLRESENKYRSLAETSSDLILTFDLNGKLTYLSPSVERITGFSASEVLRKNFWDFIAPEYIESAMAKFKKGINGERIPLYEIELIHKNKKRVPIELNVTSLLDADGKPIGRLAVARDITERKKAEKALKESEVRLQRFAEITTEGIVIHKTPAIVDANQSFLKMTGYSLSDLVGKDIIKTLATPDYYPVTYQNVKKNYAEPYDIEIFKKDGSRLPVEISGIDYLSAKGETLRAVVFRDITLRLQMENALRESEKKYREQSHLFRLMSDNIPDMVWAKDMEGCFVFTNKAFADNFLIAKDIDEPIGKKDPFFAERQRNLHPNNKKWFTFDIECSDSDALVLKLKKPVRILESGFIQGKLLHLDVYKAPIFNEKGQIVGIVGHGRDVTKEKEAEKALLLRDKALNAAANAIIITDADGKIEWVNEAFTKLSGYTEKEAFGKFTIDLVGAGKQDKTFYENLHNILKSGQVWRGEFNDRRKDGTPYEVEEIITPVTDKTGKVEHLIGIMTDITERKAAERELRAAKEIAEESSRLKSAFLANMNHEIRTPMNAIMGFSELMLEASSEDKTNYAQIVNKSAGQLLNLIDDVIFLSRLQSEKLPVKKSTFYPADLLNEIFLMFDLPEMKKSLQLQILLPKDAGAVALCADAFKIRQVITNFMSNAIKYTSIGYVKLGFELHDNSILFFVEDSGMGIPKEEQQNIFKAFYRGNLAVSSAIRGTGLGLNIAKELVELMDGTIGVISQPGKGSRFYFSIPYEPAELVVAEEDSVKPKLGKWKDLNILIAEDDETNYLYLYVLLKDKVNRVDRAPNGQEAVEMVRQNTYDLVLMDLKMPVMMGDQATREIKKFSPHLPVIATTAYATSEEKELALAAGCDDYLSKPINKTDLTALIDRYVSGEV